MPSRLRNIALIVFSAITPFVFPLMAQDDTGWHILPAKINIQVGDDRTLQLLDDSAQELHGAIWSVDDPDKAEIRHEEDGRVVINARAAGTIRVSAALNGEMRFREIKIWSSLRPLPLGTSNWAMQPIGTEIGDVPAVPTANGPNTYSLEQTNNGITYLRGVRADGIQLWSWRVPEEIRDVELVCSDWLGGALISANRNDSFALYTVSNDGKLRWQHSFVGRRKAHAYNLEHIVHILSQSADSTSTKITALDEMTGATKSELEIPPSLEEWINLKQTGKVIACSTESSSKSFPTSTSRLFVNPDGYAYVAFTLSKRTVTSLKCRGESAILPENVGVKRDDRVILWQIHSDGTYRSTVVEQFKEEQSLASPAHVASPTGAIIPDGPHGVLLSMRWIQSVNGTVAHESQDEYIYRIDENGQVVYKLLLPKYGGPLHDEMVLGENDIGFATRGSVLIAFNVRLGKEMWRWESNKASISVFAALKEGHCLVQTPDAIVEVSNSHRSREVIKGKAMIGWDGQLYLKHN